MAIGNNRNPDVTEVFDARWKANHNNDYIKNKNEESKNFTDRMFGVRNFNTNERIPQTKEDKVRELNNRVETNREINNSFKVNNIINNFRNNGN